LHAYFGNVLKQKKTLATLKRLKGKKVTQLNKPAIVDSNFALVPPSGELDQT